MNSSWANLVARRDLLRELVVSELKVSRAETSLGWIWWLLDPLLMMLIYWLVVVGILGRGQPAYAPYPIFILCALVPWKHFHTSASQSTRVLRAREALIKAVGFPTIVLPVSLVLSGFVYFLFGFVVLLAAATFWRSPLHTGSLLPLIQVPPLMLLQVAVVAGICLPLASLGVAVRDLTNFMTHVLRVGFYLSPGLYGIDLVRELLLGNVGGTAGQIGFFAYMLNPFAVLISGYRDAVFYGRYLPLEFWLILVAEAALLLVIGSFAYQRYDRRAIKYL
jgi:ABC-type polysaccharide/polyol phosphate export permease